MKATLDLGGINRTTRTDQSRSSNCQTTLRRKTEVGDSHSHPETVQGLAAQTFECLLLLSAVPSILVTSSGLHRYLTHRRTDTRLKTKFEKFRVFFSFCFCKVQDTGRKWEFISSNGAGIVSYPQRQLSSLSYMHTHAHVCVHIHVVFSQTCGL